MEGRLRRLLGPPAEVPDRPPGIGLISALALRPGIGFNENRVPYP
jgi:hypothetical protein